MSTGNTITAAPVSSVHNPSIPESGTYIARVASVDQQGKIKSVITHQGISVIIDDQSTSVAKCNGHEDCVIQVIDDQCIVTQTLLGYCAPYSLQQKDGKLILDAGVDHDAIVLKSGNSSIELKADGTLIVEGDNIKNIAQSEHTVSAERIELNNPV